MFYVLAFPELAWPGEVRRFREQFEPERAALVQAHLTIMFGTKAVAEESVVELARAAAAQVPKFDVVFQERKLVDDPLDRTTKLFFVPNDGAPLITLLHDLIYDGLPASELRVDIPFAPHMTMATTKDARRAQEAFERSRLMLPMKARVTTLTVVKLIDGKLREIAAIALT